ncbi:hypothetical protein, partial [Paraliobacillus sp. X-1268]|uniref:hypothetical protein n=1 Tax=Paraliobacillus sp. X-1268 TaxID=2213193 RepID=UPI001E5F23CC
MMLRLYGSKVNYRLNRIKNCWGNSNFVKIKRGWDKTQINNKKLHLPTVVGRCNFFIKSKILVSKKGYLLIKL